jgi:hypothetical protein
MGLRCHSFSALSKAFLRNRCGAVIVLGDYRHEGVELADTLAPGLGCGLGEDTAGGHR